MSEHSSSDTRSAQPVDKLPERPELSELPEDDVEYTVEARLKADPRGNVQVWVPMAFALRTPADVRDARERIVAALPDTTCRVLRWTSTPAVIDDAELDAAAPAIVRPLTEKAAS